MVEQCIAMVVQYFKSPLYHCCPGKEENSTVDDWIANQVNSTTTAPAINSTAGLDTSGFTHCLAVTFVNKQVNSSTEETYVALEFAAVPCVNNITTTICEVRVYEQVILS